MNLIIVFCAKYLVWLVVLGIIVAWFRVAKGAKLQFLVAAILTGAIAYLLAKIAGHFFYDPRPFVIEHIKPLIAHAANNGFPSDHALFTMALTAITFFFSKKIAAVMLGATILVGVARVLAQVHSPLDIAGGWAFGIIGAVAGYYLARWLFSLFQKNKPAPSESRY